MRLAGWGRFGWQDCKLHAPRDLEGLSAALQDGPVIARGNGRAYGDSALWRRGTIDMRGFNRMIAFDEGTGLLTAEAGVLLDEVITTFLPRGWFPRVTPGTRFVTLGGMLASDVHGKNHHNIGGFGETVAWADVMIGTGEVLRLSRQQNADLFAATIGGMGLTGVILRLAFHLEPVETGWITQQTIATSSLEETISTFEASASARYSVAWIDCLAKGESLGRSLVTLGDHATLKDLSQAQRRAPLWPNPRPRLSFPFAAPSLMLNRHTVAAFNAAYYAKGARAKAPELVSWESYFYPLDAVSRWNLMYGRRGFVQYQCVVPLTQAVPALSALLDRISQSGLGSFLAVLKRLGPEGIGMLSFPMEGYTLALDFPACDASFDLIKALELITLAHGGRHYLTKDAVLGAQTAQASDPRIQDFKALRHARQFSAHFQSSQSERLSL